MKKRKETGTILFQCLTLHMATMTKNTEVRHPVGYPIVRETIKGLDMVYVVFSAHSFLSNKTLLAKVFSFSPSFTFLGIPIRPPVVAMPALPKVALIASHRKTLPSPVTIFRTCIRRSIFITTEGFLTYKAQANLTTGSRPTPFEEASPRAKTFLPTRQNGIQLNLGMADKASRLGDFIRCSIKSRTCMATESFFTALFYLEGLLTLWANSDDWPSERLGHTTTGAIYPFVFSGLKGFFTILTYLFHDYRLTQSLVNVHYNELAKARLRQMPLVGP